MKGSSGGKIVEPGDTGSTLIAVVRQTAEPKMPPEGDKLSNDQIQILKRWIEGGLVGKPVLHRTQGVETEIRDHARAPIPPPNRMARRRCPPISC